MVRTNPAVDRARAAIRVLAADPALTDRKRLKLLQGIADELEAIIAGVSLRIPDDPEQADPRRI